MGLTGKVKPFLYTKGVPWGEEGGGGAGRGQEGGGECSDICAVLACLSQLAVAPFVWLQRK